MRTDPSGRASDDGRHGLSIREAGHALDTGSADALVSRLAARAGRQLRQRLQRTLDAKAHAAESPAQGRAYVAAYVDFIHYAERLEQATGAVSAGETADAGDAHAH